MAGLVLLALTFGSPAEEPAEALFTQYRALFRPVLGRSCVFEPSCSAYAEEAVMELGLPLGIAAAFERWTRCTSSARSEGDYPSAPGGRIPDPVRAGETGGASWGRSLLPF